MGNSIIFVLSVLIYLGTVLLLYKFMGKSGLYLYVIISTILCNLQVCICVDIFGLSTTAGNVLYAASFLVTDILSEKYGKKSAHRAVIYGVVTTIIWLLGTQSTMLMTPNANDYVSESMKVVFGLVPRVSIASLISYVICQYLDVFLYHYVWSKSGNGKKFLWLRNNVGTLVSQMVDTILFTTLAFWGVYPTPVFVSILLTTYLFKAIVAFADTPFLYLARMIKPVDEV